MSARPFHPPPLYFNSVAVYTNYEIPHSKNRGPSSLFLCFTPKFPPSTLFSNTPRVFTSVAVITCTVS